MVTDIGLATRRWCLYRRTHRLPRASGRSPFRAGLKCSFIAAPARPPARKYGPSEDDVVPSAQIVAIGCLWCAVTMAARAATWLSSPMCHCVDEVMVAETPRRVGHEGKTQIGAVGEHRRKQLQLVGGGIAGALNQWSSGVVSGSTMPRLRPSSTTTMRACDGSIRRGIEDVVVSEARMRGPPRTIERHRD
jgi:hypothetical protein